MNTISDLKEMAATLPVEDRASLASFLIHSLPETDYDVSDEEVAERVRQIQTGAVETITMSELREGTIAERLR